ncbi:hypothetical protein Aperf_G00000054771 [Anoplocephala perfoliata]
MHFQAFVFLFISIGYKNAASADIVSALDEINEAIAAGRHLAAELTSHISTEEARLDKLRQIVRHLINALEISSTSEEDQSTSLMAEGETTANPVSAFLIILRLASNWSNELSMALEVPNIQLDGTEALIAALLEFHSRTSLFLRLKGYAERLPDDDDVQGALEAVIRLQQTYNISSIDIAEGNILSYSSSPSLTERQCFQLGQYSYELLDYSHAIEWYTVVLDRIDERRRIGKSEVGSDTVAHWELYDHLSYALGRAGRYNEALEATKKLLMENPASISGAHSKTFYEEELVRLNGNDPPHTDDESERTERTENYVFEDLCRQANKWIPPSSNMSCRFSTPHSYFKLGPLKVEVLLDDPLVLQFHDFVTQKEADQLIKLARPKLQRALVRSNVPGLSELAAYRTAKNVWLADDLNYLTKRINKRIRMATGLNIDHGEELQLANYGLGGHYAPHYDYTRLTPVELGGGTAFTKIGLVVKPIARSMVFWYNLLHNGDGDPRSRHGACPVLAGNKWVMNKWIRSAGQEFTHPCRPEPEPFNIKGEYLGP